MPFPVDDKWILEAEERLNVILPIEYKTSLSQMNGGSLFACEETWDLYPIWDKSNRKRLKRTCNDIVHETQVCNDCYGFPENGVAIATNGCGDQLIFLPSEGSLDALESVVYFWSHETGEIEKIADNFSEIKRENP